jgi:hypothetical protein
MSKIDELKKQHPYYDKSFIDVLSHVFEKPKYVEMAIKLFKNKTTDITPEWIKTVKHDLVDAYCIPQEKIDNLHQNDLEIMFCFYNVLVGSKHAELLTNFVDYNERKLINQSDVTTYKSFDEMESQVSLAELKLVSKELQAQTEVLYDSTEWLVLKPLSFEASLKYGASTKWCTAMRHDPEYFSRYSRRGILIYCINRLTGNKVAAFKNLNTDYEYETSFWDVKDIRIDSMEADLPRHVLDIIKYQFSNVTVTNWEVMSDEAKGQKQMYEQKSLIQPSLAENVGGLGLAIRNAITYDGPYGVEEPQVEMQMEERVVACNTAPPSFMGDVEQAWRD